MSRILIAECLHEVSSFNPVPTRYEDFSVTMGEGVRTWHRSIGTEVGGALNVFSQDPTIKVIPTYSARGITSGGTIPAADFRRLADEFLTSIRRASAVDGAYIVLHGAMAAVGEDDPEGYLLAETRKILGNAIPIVASFDLHGVLTDRMLRHVDAAVPYHTYPHVDFFETGQRSARLLKRILAQEARPVMAKVYIPALVRGDELVTETGLFGRMIRHAQEIEGGPGGLSAGLFIGNPFTDVPDLASYSLVVTDDEPELAIREALSLANEFWTHRHRLHARLTSLDESLRLALEVQRGTVILMDAADATSSGASGDSVAIVQALRDAGYHRRILAPVVDPSAVQAAFAKGVGGRVQMSIGGALDPFRFKPMTISATVRLLSDGCFRSESFGQEWNSGLTAVLEAENVTFVASSRPVHLFDRSLFLAHGQDPQRFDLVVVKSPHCQPHMFADWCARLINVDAPGSTSANLQSLGHTKCRRPIYPLDSQVAFEPRATLFRRHELALR